MGTNKASDYQIMVFGTTVGNPEVGRGMIISVQNVVIKGESGNPDVGITSPKKIAKFLGRVSFPTEEEVVKIKFEKVTAIEIDGELDIRILVHGKILTNKKKDAGKKEIIFSEAPTDPKEGKAIAVLILIT